MFIFNCLNKIGRNTMSLQSNLAQQGVETQLINQIMIALSNTVEAKDRYTNGHSQRVACYARDIVQRMGGDKQQQQRVYYAGLLHDVGKIRVSDAIINKTGRLTKEEYEEMKLHTLAGYYILKEVSIISDFAVSARWHHERYDGKGYPNGLSGENIPLICRIIGVADAYDAMTSNRSYRKVLPQAVVRDEIQKGMGSQFDPKIAQIMLKMIDEDPDYHLHQFASDAPKTILAIDDDRMVLQLLKFAIGKMPGYRLLTAPNGKEGLKIFNQEQIDLVLLDVEMSEMDGFEVLSQIRKLDAIKPVIFMTGDREMELIQKAEAMGINDYLTKPLVMHMLKESIQNVMSTSRNFK